MNFTDPLIATAIGLVIFELGLLAGVRMEERWQRQKQQMKNDVRYFKSEVIK